RGKNLDRHLLRRGDLRSEIDIRHAALAQLFHDLIAGIEQLSGEIRGALDPFGRWTRFGLHIGQHAAVAGAVPGAVGVDRTAARAAPLAHWRTRSRPSFFARYSAWSASATNASGPAMRSSGNDASPMLTVM